MQKDKRRAEITCKSWKAHPISTPVHRFSASVPSSFQSLLQEKANLITALLHFQSIWSLPVDLRTNFQGHSMVSMVQHGWAPKNMSSSGHLKCLTHLGTFILVFSPSDLTSSFPYLDLHSILNHTPFLLTSHVSFLSLHSQMKLNPRHQFWALLPPSHHRHYCNCTTVGISFCVWFLFSFLLLLLTMLSSLYTPCCYLGFSTWQL